ncbi:MAG TPA: TadE/TadG family type IV pilus assembly protein [Xanthobacteraceae bacterium]|jgi:Flp pilus assembly protein TadG
MIKFLTRAVARLDALRTSRDGNVAIIFALAIIPVLGLVGSAVDYSRASLVRSRLQAAADSAALFAATGSTATDSARVTAGTSAFTSQYGSVTPTVAVADGAVSVTANISVPTTLTSLFGFKNVPVSATSVANIGSGTSACVLALQTSGDGIFVHGGSSLKANCGLYANSTSSNGIDFDGDSVTSAGSICVANTYVRDSQAKVTPKPQTKCPAMPDPLASLPAPANAASSCTYNNFQVNGTGTLNPGVYCGGINIGSNAKATFNPGVYVIRDGQFTIGSNTQVTGQGVMFYLTGSNANLDQGSNSYLNVTAPTSGTYQGVVFFQSRTANTSANRFGGGSNTIVQGAVYFPNGTAEINSNGAVMANGDYTIWIVKYLQIDSGATLQVNSNYTGSTTPLASGVSTMVLGSRAYLTR